MKIVSMSEVSAEPFIHDVFTGPDVTRQELAPGGSEFEVTVVNFDKGMRNKLHAHDGEQILIVTEGEGFVSTEKEQYKVSAGDLIFIEAGEAHWHGATEDSAFSHIFIQKKDRVLTQIEA